MWLAEVSIVDGRYSLSGVVMGPGEDICLCVYGGEQHHIGASALAVPHPSLTAPGQTSSSASLICVPGHKEDVFVKYAAETLAAKFNCVAGVCAGVHIENAQPEEIKRLSGNMMELLDLVMEKIGGIHDN